MAATEGADGGALARIFVGGLAEGVAAADLEGMFASFGPVAAVEFVRTNGRSFAYVDFRCPSDKALAKLFSTYNGCKWKGGKLRLEKAKEHYLVRLKREWKEDAAAQAMPMKDNVEKQKPEKAVLDTLKINLYFPKLRKVKALPFKGTGKHKYSFRHIEVPSYPIHFCDCEEHCGPPEAANDEYASVLNAAAYEKERNIMNSVMSKLFENNNENIDSLETQKYNVDANTTEPSDVENDMQMEEAEEIPEEELYDMQMEETEEPCEEDLDDLVINVVSRKPNNTVMQLNREERALNKDSWFGKCQQFEDNFFQKKRQKSKDLYEPRNNKLSTSMMSDKRTTVKSLPSMSGANQKEQKTTGLSAKGAHDFSSILNSDKSSRSLQGVQAQPGSSTKNGSAKNMHTTEPKKGVSWTQKSAWKDLVGGMGATSFSISQVLPSTNTAPPPVQKTTETLAPHSESKNKVKLGVKSSRSLEVMAQASPEQKLQGSVRMPPSATTIRSVGCDSRGHSEDNKSEKLRVVPKITISEVCPFMRNPESEKQFLKAKKVLTGFIKKSNENTGSNSGKGKPPSRR